MEMVIAVVLKLVEDGVVIVAAVVVLEMLMTTTVVLRWQEVAVAAAVVAVDEAVALVVGQRCGGHLVRRKWGRLRWWCGGDEGGEVGGARCLKPP